MFQRLELQQLLLMPDLKEVRAYKAEAETRKAELEALKSKGGKGWTPELQDELNDIVIILVDVDGIIEQREAEARKAAERKPEAAGKPSYEVPAGTEGMVHLKLIKGHRYSPTTGEEISEPFVQIFTFGEYQLFRKNSKSLGYTVVEVLHNPYKD